AAGRRRRGHAGATGRAARHATAACAGGPDRGAQDGRHSMAIWPRLRQPRVRRARLRQTAELRLPRRSRARLLGPPRRGYAGCRPQGAVRVSGLPEAPI
ncbi:unnamed protein product, partial [Phaeothamnion confervicola]